MWVVCTEVHNRPVFHQVRNNRKIRGHSYEGQDIFMLKPLPSDNLPRKQLEIRLSNLFKIYKLDHTLCAVLGGSPFRW